MKHTSLIIPVLLAVWSCSCTGGDNQAGRLFHQGEIHYHAKKLVQARGLFQQVLEQDSNHAGALLMLGKVSFFLNNPDDSLRYLNRLLERYPHHPGGLYWTARARVRMKKYKDAEEILERLLTVDSSHCRGQLLLALLYRRGNNHNRAVRTYLEILGNQELLIQARRELADLYMSFGLMKQAKRERVLANRLSELTREKPQ